MGKMRSYRMQQTCRMFCVVGVLCAVMCGGSSCGWKDAQEVIATAERMDKTEHVVYDDTVALGHTIRTLDNPFGRLLMSNTLGKAYYYMGRNFSLSNQIPEAADCYIEADRLQIDDPIYRGRVNSCMGYICAQNCSDSLALIFYERASEDFKESGNEWRYAQSVLNLVMRHIALQQYTFADTLLQIAQTYQLDSNYQARWYETCGLYFYAQQQYDSALVYLKKGLHYWQNESEKCFNYLKIMQIHYDMNELHIAIPYAKLILSLTNNPNYISNAYYCLMQDAKINNNTELLSQYSHARTDAQKLLRKHMMQDALALPVLKEHLHNPYPFRKLRIILICVLIVCMLITAGAVVYRKRTRIVYQYIDQLSTHVENQKSLLSQELYHRQFVEKLANIVDRYHIPHKRWKDYKNLKKDLNPWIHAWMCQLDTYPLSEREKIFCTISLVYSHMTDTEIAEYICYGKSGIRVFKQRIAKKLGTTSADFLNFLRNLPLSEH